jgi:hypothetical protein
MRRFLRRDTGSRSVTPGISSGGSLTESGALLGGSRDDVSMRLLYIFCYLDILSLKLNDNLNVMERNHFIWAWAASSLSACMGGLL